ncbi:hypothetical protein C2S52_008466 [Perilla frutescens var. hirtella]|nr:hypothetical protein C2S52_008466 [Perilla frutescens var. hirtella]
MSRVGEIYVVTASGSGHLFPCIQLCNLLSSTNYTPTLVLPSSAAVSPSLLRSIAAIISITAPARGKPTDAQMGSELESHLSTRPESPNALSAAIVDFQMSWTNHIFWKFNIPVMSLFTFSACAAAMEWGAWKSGAGGVGPGEAHLIPGLPHEMSITHQDVATARRPIHPPRAAGPPRPGDRPPWVPLVEGSIALMFNTCEDLERPFLNYLSNQIGLPAWGVGPLLPNQLLSTPAENDDQLFQWLDEKQEKSVLYVAFGSEVSPNAEEILQLATTFQEIECPFIWVVQNSIGIDGGSESLNFDVLGKKIGDRGFIIRGWAPQVLILSHRSIGGFLSHCGWNSTLEAIGCGVPILAWPLRGDQIYNAKLVANHLKIGHIALPSGSSQMTKCDLIGGIEKLMRDEVVRGRVEILRAKFNSGFPSTSKFALETFIDLVKLNQI